MLTQRQIEILLTFYSEQNSTVKLSNIADYHHVSVRTIQNDLQVIKEVCQNNGMEIRSIPSRGCSLFIHNAAQADEFILEIKKNYYKNVYFSDQMFRVNFLIKQLLESNDFQKSQDLADKMFISRSRISNDLNIVREHLKKYHLELLSKPSYGIKIAGDEIEKRHCLIKENILFKLDSELMEDKYLIIINKVKDIVTQILLDGHYQVSDIILQNLIIHIYTSVKRMKDDNYLEVFDRELSIEYQHELSLAKNIIEKCCQIFRIHYNENEVKFLAVNLRGKREYSNDEYISQEINRTIYEGLEKIKIIYGVDLTNDLDLRISLGLHLIPLKSRVETHMQLKNITAYNVKQSFPFAFDIASTFFNSIFQDHQNELSDDELSYIALHFISSLEKYVANNDLVSILIISSHKKSETILIQQKIKKWFNNISEIVVKSVMNVRAEDFDKYDAILTTEKKIASDHPRARLINYFLNDEDFKKIESALSGLNSIKDILNKFDKELFFVGNVHSKEEIIEILFKKAKKKYQLTDELFHSVLYHEQTTSTYFGNCLAMPHPEKLITDVTFIAVGILPQEIVWGKTNKVNIVFLVSIEKDNSSAFQLWYYLSYLISDNDALKNILEKPTYENLIETVKKIYENLF